MTAKQISRDVILYANQAECSVTNLKLQKTLYYLQGYYSKYFDEPLFSDEFEHWPYGPVVPSVYFEYCQFGAGAISVNAFETPFSDFGNDEKKAIRKVVNECLHQTARSLVNKSHKEAPWLDANPSEIIPFSAIKHYFKNNDPLGIGSL